MVDYSGAVLAGGKSSRFGSNKARYVHQNKSLIQHVLASLGPASEHFIIANQPYPDLELPVYGDILTVAGPLTGIHAALHYARYDWVAVAACDMPLLTVAYWQELATYCTDALVVVKSERGLEPLAAFYPRRLKPAIAQYLAAGGRSVQGFLETTDKQVIPLANLKLNPDVLKNINHPAELP